jgi:alanyl-tRNA synthetase
LKTSTEGLADKVQVVLNASKALEKDFQQLKIKSATSAAVDLVERAETIKGVKVLVTEVNGIDSKALRDTADQLRGKLGSGVVVLALMEGAKVSLVVAVSKDLTDRIKAGELVNNIAEQVGGKGGGRADLAMAGGTRPEGLAQALASVRAYVAQAIQ